MQTTPAWLRRNRLGACPAVGRRGADCRARTAERGVPGCTRLQAADGVDLLSGPDPQREGAAAAAEDGIGAAVQLLERRHGATAADPDEAGGEEVGWQLSGQVKTGSGAGAPAKKKQEHLKSFGTFNKRFHSKLIRLQKLIWQDNWSSINSVLSRLQAGFIGLNFEESTGF